MTVKFTAHLAEPSTEGSASIFTIEKEVSSIEEMIEILTKPRKDGNTIRRAIVHGADGTTSTVHFGDLLTPDEFLALYAGHEGLSITTLAYMDTLKISKDSPGVVTYGDAAMKLLGPEDWVYSLQGKLLHQPRAAKGVPPPTPG